MRRPPSLLVRLTPAAALALCVAAAPAQDQGLTLVNGTVGYIDVPYDPTLAPSSGLTVEAWVTYDGGLAAGVRYPTVLRMDSTPQQSSYLLRVEAGSTQANKVLWRVRTTNGISLTTWNFAPGALQAWTHLAATYDGSTSRLFVNGVQVAQNSATGDVVYFGPGFRIGSGDLTIPGGETWNGEIDEVRVWPFARSAAAIASTMNMKLSSLPGEVSVWNLDGNALDASGNNSGVVVGSLAFTPNSLTPQIVAFPGLLALNYGSGCRQDALAAASALANLGNTGFSVVGIRAPAGALGFLVLSTSAQSVPYSFAGIDVFPDANSGVVLSVAANSLGTAQLPLAIPRHPLLLGFTFFSQFAWLDGSCSSGLTASNVVLSIVAF